MLATLAGCQTSGQDQVIDAGAGSSDISSLCVEAEAAPGPLVQPLPRDRFDDALLVQAVRRATNRERCDRGLAPLESDGALVKAAVGHSEAMAELDFFDHRSPVRGRETLDRRLRASRARYEAAGENLAKLARFDFRNRRYIVRDGPACDFAFSASGPAIEPLSYADLGTRLVDLWLESPGHRRNLLDPRWSRIGAGAALLPAAEVCGELLVTQVFAR